MTSPRNYNKILAGTALRYAGYPALLRAVNLAAHTGGTVVGLHAMPEESDRARNGAISHPNWIGEAKYQLGRMQAAHPQICETRVIADQTWIALIDVARELEVDLVVIGSHVHSQLTALFGKASDRILHQCKRDVLTVRSESYTAERPPSDFRNIVFAADLNAPTDNAAARAAALARLYGAQLTLLHVVEHYPTNRESDDIAREDEDPLEHQQRVKGDRLRTLAERIGAPEAKIRVVVSEETAKSVVPAAARELGADLVVTGSPAHPALHILFGSTADAIVHHAPCDVLVVRG